MWEQLSPTKKFSVVASGVVALCSVAIGVLVLVLLSGGGVAAGEEFAALLKGVLLIGIGASTAYRSYNLATRGTEDPEGAGFRHKSWERSALERRERIARRADNTAQAAEKTDTTTTKVRCLHCQHVQTVPISQPTFVCEQCEAHI